MQYKKTPRHLARSLAVQGIYSVRMNQCSILEVEQFLQETNGSLYNRIDYSLMHELIEKTIKDFDNYLERYIPYLRRKIDEINLTEQVILAIAANELLNSLSIPATVIINEAVELAKLYGAPDSYKFINGLVDKLASELRSDEQQELSNMKKHIQVTKAT